MRPAAALFLWTTVATSITGYFFPFHKLLPSHIVGLLSLIVLAIAFRARNRWPKTYVISSMIALYLNVFVLIFQLFLKVPALKALVRHWIPILEPYQHPAPPPAAPANP